VQRIEDQKRVLQLADFLVRLVDLDGVREARDERHHARAMARQVLGVVQHEVQAPGAAGEQEFFDALDAHRIVQQQRRAVRIESAQLAAGLLEQAVDRRLEAGAIVEAVVCGLAHFAFSRCR
jgi:hypothetical protein